MNQWNYLHGLSLLMEAPHQHPILNQIVRVITDSTVILPTELLLNKLQKINLILFSVNK